MTDPGPRRGVGSIRPLDVLANAGMAAAYRTLLVTLRPLVVGRRLAVRMESGTLALTVRRLDSQLDLAGIAAGRRHDVRLEAEDLSWGGHRFDRAEVTLHDVHLRGNLRPTELVAAPVELAVDVPAPALDGVFTSAASRLTGEVGPDGVARLHLAKRRGSGHVEVDARLDGSTLVITPRAVVRRRRWLLPARTPSYRIRVPDLPHGLQLTSIDFAPGVVRLAGTLPHWRADVPRTRLEDILGQLGAVGRPLTVIWPGGAGTRR